MLSQIDDSDKRLNGVVYTPVKVARALTRMTLKRCGVKAPSILEPSAGDGEFLRAIRSSKFQVSKIDAVDIDVEATNTLQDEFSDIAIHTSDFLDFFFSNSKTKYDVVIGNPPYIRQHNFKKSFRANIDRLSETTYYQRFQLKNAWAAFVVAASSMLSEDGVLAFVVPYELINVKYGVYLQSFLGNHFDRIEIFVPDEKAFKDIDQDAVVVLATKKSARKKGFHIHKVKDLGDLKPVTTRAISYAEPKTLSVELKSIFFNSETSELLHKLRRNLTTVRDLAESSAGIVTAANDYFILKACDVDRFKLGSWSREILKKGSFLSGNPTFSHHHLSILTATEPAYLIDFHREGAPPLSEAAKDYIRYGEELGLDKRYKSQCRNPWYRIPIVKASDGFFFKRSHSFPRLCINEAKVLVTDTAYQVRVKNNYSMRGVCYSFYNSMTLLFSEIDGRFYGGGVLELTPNEFKGLPLAYVEPTDKEFSLFEMEFPGSKNAFDADFSSADNCLRHKLQLTELQMENVQDALVEVRTHRLRHGLKVGR